MTRFALTAICLMLGCQRPVKAQPEPAPDWFGVCFAGPSRGEPGHLAACDLLDADADGDVDLSDAALWMLEREGP